MKTFHVTLGGLLVAGFFAFSGCEPQIPVELPAIPLASVEPYFSEAAEIEAIDTSYYQVKDAEGNLLGTVLFSMPYSASVNGYNGTTPLLITLDAENHITNVVLRDHHETPRYAQRVEENGLYQSWNGLSVDEALAKDVDAVSGATYTSTGVKNTLAVRLKAYQRQLTKDYNATKPSFWQRLFAPKKR